MAPVAIYVETFIREELDEVWRVTQAPSDHVRWDVRFSRIDPEPGSEGESIHFTC